MIMNNILDLKKLSDIEIKALAYDELIKLEICQNNLRALNKELYDRSVSQTSSDVLDQPK